MNRYVEHAQEEVVSPEAARQEFYAAMDEVFKAEEKLKMLLQKGGYLDE